MAFYEAIRDTAAADRSALKPGPNERILQERNAGLWLVKEPPVLDGASIEGAQAQPDERGAWRVAIAFTPTGTKTFGALTARLVRKHLAIVLDGVIQSCPLVAEPITGGRSLIVLGPATAADRNRPAALALAAILSSGSLHETLRLVSMRGGCPRRE